MKKVPPARKKELLAEYEKINSILAEWNPIGVPDTLALDEYRAYAARIYRAKENRDELIKALESVLVAIGRESADWTAEERKDLLKFADRFQRME